MFREAGKPRYFVAINDVVKSQTILNNSERQKVTGWVVTRQEAKTEKGDDWEHGLQLAQCEKHSWTAKQEYVDRALWHTG